MYLLSSNAKQQVTINIKRILYISSGTWHFFNQMWCSLNFSEVSTLKEIFGIATDGRSRSSVINLQPAFTVLTNSPPATLIFPAEHEAAMVKYSRLPKKKENEKVECWGRLPVSVYSG